MRFFSPSKRTSSFALVGVGALAALLLPIAFGQDAPNRDASNPNAPTADAPNLPARATPGDYAAHGVAGDITIAADFTGHNVSTPQAIFATEDYVVVEVAFFGAPGARLSLSFADFSLRINGKKVPTPAQPYGLLFESLKDPEWEPASTESKSKTSIGSHGGGANDAPAAPPKMPIGMKRLMQQRVRWASMPEGDRPLPEAGLLYFPYHGKAEGIRQVELIYSGAAGKANFELHP